MSVAEQITRIQADRNTIRNKLVELGLATSTDSLDSLAATIDEIVNRGAVLIQLKEGEEYIIPQGWHPGTGKVTGVAGGGSYTLQDKNITPTKKQQSVNADSGYFGLGTVIVAAIPDAYQDVSQVTASAANVLTGKIIVTADGAVIAGTMLNNGALSKSIDGLTETSASIPAGYTSGGTVSLTGDIEAALAAI